MGLKTENLAIVLTDIVGFTETTAQQSRQENEFLLDTHNQILLPIVKRYKGRLVKSIGDALLLVFRSPTDAMLCSMAMQDALFEYNRDIPDQKQIHIRVAASLGEVRITRNDIFGEPVNTTSRIEGVTPKDEIYFSEAIYMAMNKAEVPCKEVGWKELKGISEPIRLFNIPRFSTPRLVPEDVMSSSDISDLVYPYGGAHLSSQGSTQDSSHFSGFIKKSSVQKTALVASLIIIPLIAALAYFVMDKQSETQLQIVKTAPVPAPRLVPKVIPRVIERPKPKPAIKPEARPKQAVVKKAPPKQKTVVKRVPKPKPKPVARPKPAPRPVAKSTPEDKMSAAADELVYLSIRQARKDYGKKIITQEEYKQFIKEIKDQMSLEIKYWKTKLKAKEITKKIYKLEYNKIRKKYK